MLADAAQGRRVGVASPLFVAHCPSWVVWAVPEKEPSHQSLVSVGLPAGAYPDQTGGQSFVSVDHIDSGVAVTLTS